MARGLRKAGGKPYLFLASDDLLDAAGHRHERRVVTRLLEHCAHPALEAIGVELQQLQSHIGHTRQIGIFEKCDTHMERARASRPRQPPSNRAAAPREQRCPQPRPGYTQGGGGSTRTCFQNLTIGWPPRTSPMSGTASAAAVSLSSHSELSPPWKKMSAYHSSNTQYLS